MSKPKPFWKDKYNDNTKDEYRQLAAFRKKSDACDAQDGRFHSIGTSSTSLGSKYFDETEELYDKMWDFTHKRLGSIGYDALYVAARELGMTVEQATAFCTSKWIRHNEDYLQEMFAQAIITAFGTQEMFSNMMNYLEGFVSPYD